MEYFWLLGALILLLAKSVAPEVLKFDKKWYFEFLQLMLYGFVASIVVNVVIGRFPPLPHNLGFGILMVWWEDLAFSLLPIYLAHKYLRNKYLIMTITVITSLLFGLGHVYQGYFWAAITTLYPYFFSYRVGKAKGYLTVMLAHVTYDVVVSTIAIILYIIGASK